MISDGPTGQEVVGTAPEFLAGPPTFPRAIVRPFDVSRSDLSSTHFGNSSAATLLRRPRMRLVTALWLGMLVIPSAAQDCRNGGAGQLMTFSYPMDTGGTMN